MKEKLKEKFQDDWPYLVIIIATYLMIQGQLNTRGFVLNIDTWFHYNRFYDISKQIRTGNYSYFQMNYGFSQSGRIINAFYGPLFAYIMGLLVLITGTWFRFQIVSYFLICLLGGSGMYILVKKVGANKLWSLILALLYINISPLQTWFDHTNLSGWGSAIAPFVFIEAVNMIRDKKRPIHWIGLMLGMTALLQTHLLSSLMVTLALIPFAITGFILTPQKKQMILNLTKAIVGTICLTANVWGALLTVSVKNKLATIRTHNLVSNMVEVSTSENIRDAILVGVVIIFLVQLLYVLFNWKKSILNDVVTLTGVFFLYISSSLFPWQLIQRIFPILRSYLQFPFRFLLIADILLILGIGISVSQINWKEKQPLYYGVLGCIAIVLVESCNLSYNRLWQAANNNYTPLYKIVSKKYYTTTSEYAQRKYIKYLQGVNSDSEAYGMKYYPKGYHYIKSFTSDSFFYRNTNDFWSLKQAVFTKKRKENLFNLVIKVNPDYLPVKNSKISYHQVNYAFEKEVIDQEDKFKKAPLKDGALKIQWIGKKEGQRQLPIVMYKQSQLVVNNKKVTPLHYSLIKSPTIFQKKGHNTAILKFIWPTSFKILFGVSIISWLGLIIYGIESVIRKFKEAKKE
ncbi:hypothetical protein FP435_02225 [Lactobacillus sp. PV037]|uniref:6-pyruvoyl-tetrahydropterin synthase-related protein n=1 Tax=Lactobacillus sp. PV037 TaxID=2594496 RepID=UPI00223F9D8F|nr:6-pyruvoyl-tetrahydropterin synthase-related protein [Lactobacillus sp. PV037]QNQ83334.1 hypothetical protein FP435_02225 [Lactobacillus sp. PV037]